MIKVKKVRSSLISPQMLAPYAAYCSLKPLRLLLLSLDGMLVHRKLPLPSIWSA